MKEVAKALILRGKQEVLLDSENLLYSETLAQRLDMLGSRTCQWTGS